MTKKKKPNLIIDTRETKPWNFEDDDSFDEIIHQKLDAGDYAIEGLEHIIVIERKASVDELYSNFCTKAERSRIDKEFERLQDCRTKIIIVEENYEDLLNPKSYYVNKKKINKRSPLMPPIVVCKALNEMVLLHGAVVMFGGSKAKELAKNLLIQANYLHGKDLI